MAKKKKIVCTCTKCRGFVDYEGSQEIVGKLLTPRTVNKHLARDAALNDSSNAISGRVLLTAASKPPTRQGSLSLPIRRRDSEQLSGIRDSSAQNKQPVRILSIRYVRNCSDITRPSTQQHQAWTMWKMRYHLIRLYVPILLYPNHSQFDSFSSILFYSHRPNLPLHPLHNLPNPFKSVSGAYRTL